MGLDKNCLTPRYISSRCILNIADNNLNRTTSELDLCTLVTHYWIFLSPRGIILPKIIRPDPNLNTTCVFSWVVLTHLYTVFQFKISICNGDNERKLKINGICLSPRGITLLKNYSTKPKFELNLRILVKHLYTKFHLKMSICNGDNERKLKINGIFLSPRGITQPKIIQPDPNSNSTCVFSWQTFIPNFNSKCQFVMEIMSGNRKLMEFF